MKTPMQELLDKINNEEFDHLDDCKMFIQEYMLEKEKEVMCEFAFRFNHDAFTENYIKAEFEETFNNK